MKSIFGRSWWEEREKIRKHRQLIQSQEPRKTSEDSFIRPMGVPSSSQTTPRSKPESSHGFVTISDSSKPSEIPIETSTASSQPSSTDAQFNGVTTEDNWESLEFWVRAMESQAREFAGKPLDMEWSLTKRAVGESWISIVIRFPASPDSGRPRFRHLLVPFDHHNIESAWAWLNSTDLVTFSSSGFPAIGNFDTSSQS